MNVPDEGQVNSERAVGPRAVDTQKHTVCDARPARVLRRTVETHLTKQHNTSHHSSNVHLKVRDYSALSGLFEFEQLCINEFMLFVFISSAMPVTCHF